MRTPGRFAILAVAAGTGLGGCAPSGPGGRRDAPAPALQRPAGPVTLDEARAWVLALVNRDRAAEGLGAVELDDAASRAAQRHVEDMARNGFTAHWGSDGSVPEERYTEAGGIHLATENAACFFDALSRQLDPARMFDAAALERIEAAFIGEVPPDDGHRRNILDPSHLRLGVGLAVPVGMAQPCMAQEFVDVAGAYDALPGETARGSSLRVAGEIHSPLVFGAVGVVRLESPKPMAAADLNRTSTYRMPEPSVLYAPAGFQTPKPVTVAGPRFAIEVPLPEGGRPGRYEISIWARQPGKQQLEVVSLRTVRVR